MAIMLPCIWLGSYFMMRWQNQYPTGMVPYPMGEKARDPKANRDAIEADLAAGERMVRFWWRLWPIFAATLLFGIGLAVFNATA